MNKFNKYFVILFSLFILLLLPTSIKAESCTYRSTVNNQHIDIQINSSDWTNLGILEIVNNNHNIVWGKMYQPEGPNWYTTWESLTKDVFYALVGGNNKDTAYWGFNAYEMTNTIPYGIYSVDYLGDLTSENYYIQVNHPEDKGANYVICKRVGDVNRDNVSTLIFAPGLGASWNLPDFISCGKDASGTWSLAPYAANVYSKVLESLSNAGWKTKPFYYDWRQNVSENSTLLSSFIDANTPSGEKANFVGHSMGGLIGRGYMQANSGGKLDKYYSVGTPHQGSALAYAPWEGGEVWTENLVEKIAIDLYLKHCGGIVSNNRETIQSLFPSVQNLLPTFPYLQDRTTNILKSISSMKITNNFISSNFIAPFWNVKVGTLSGDGQKTLNIIDVVNPSRLDIKLGNWIDGFPIKKEYSNEGDGTVLKTSSEIFGALQNDVITQTHRNLVTSTDGINKILSFLGSPEISGDDNTTETSAIVLVGYPGNFQVTNEKGEVVQSDKGMVVITNPTDSAYQIQFDPNDSKTTLIIDQVLSNGQIAYREYKYPQAPTEAKILEFDSKHASNNPIHEVKEYKKPHFPIFWHGFWKWWNKYNK